MSQYSTGTVNVTNGSATVNGVGTAFSSEVVVGDLFVRSGDSVSYEIAAVVSDTQLTLSASYSGVTASGVAYVIARDFTANQNIPYIQRGDFETATIVKRSMLKIDELLTSGVPVSVKIPIVISMVQDAEANLIPYDGLLNEANFSVTAVSIFAEIPPTGAAVVFRLLKDGVEVSGSDATLADGASHQKTIYGSAFSFTTSERLGLKCVQAGSTTPGGGLVLTLHTQ